MTRRRRILIVLAGVLTPLALALAWLLGTASGLRFALARAEQASGGALSVQQAEGRLAGPLTLTGLRLHAAAGPDVRVAQVHADLSPWALLLGHVHLTDLRVQRLDVDLPPASPPSANSAPFDPRAPLHLQLDQARLDNVRVHRGDSDLFVARRIDLAGTWTRTSLTLKPLRVQAPDGRIDLDARVALRAGYPGRASGEVDWQAGSRRWQGRLTATSDGRTASASVALTRPGAAHADLTLATRAPYAWTAKVALPRSDAATWLGTGSGIGQLAATLDAHGDRQSLHATGTLDADAQRVQLATLDARLGDHGKRITLGRLTLRAPPHAGSLDASGTIDLAPAMPSARLRVTWSGVTVPATPASRAVTTHGTLDLHGSLDRYSAVLDAVAGPPRQPATLQARASGTPQRITIDALSVKQGKGQLDASGHVDLGARRAWQLALTARAFDPGLLLPRWPGAVDARLTSRGHLDKGGATAQLAIQHLGGTLRQRHVTGKGTLDLSSTHVLSGHMGLGLGKDQLRLDGAPGAANRVDLDLRVGALGHWLDGADGSLAAKLRLTGPWPRLAVRGDIDARQLDWHGQRAGTLSAHLDVPDLKAPGGRVTLSGTDLHAGGFRFKTLTLDAHGNGKVHALDLKASGDPLSLRLALDGSLHGKAWKGRLTRLDLGLSGQPGWHLEAPAALTWGDGKAGLGQACLTAGAPRLCLAATRDTRGALDARYTLRAVPLELPLALAGNDLPMRARGTLEGHGEIQRSAAGALSGQATLTSTEGAVAYLDHPGQPLLDYHALDATLDLAPGKRQLRVRAGLQQSGSLDGRVRMRGPQHALSGHLRMRLDSLRFVELFSTALANVKGQLQADLDVGGTLAAPSLAGSASADKVSAELPTLGLKLQQGQLRVSGSDAAALRIDGQVQSGKGTLTVTGTAGLGPGQSTQLALRGSQVQMANIPSATVSLSPDVTVQGNAKGLRIAGKLGVDAADVNLEKLPGAGATEASPDVVVVDADKPAERGANLPVTTDVQVDLGDKAHVVGYGLDGNLHGSLRVTTRSGQPAQGQGQIGIDGTFSAYGQDLTITRGQLLFAASPLDNPGLDIRAVRKLNPNATVDDGQQVGLQVSGTARHPSLTVFSNPAMEQSDALSYLITGKPLSQVKAGEGSAVDSAAQALGSATGDLLAKRVGSRLGISDIGVSSNQALGTTAFTVGKYLSPRLYLSYGVGLFQPGQVVTLRYILSRRWNFEAQQSTESSRASFNYRYEH